MTGASYSLDVCAERLEAPNPVDHAIAGGDVERRDRAGAVDDLTGADGGGAAEDHEVDQRVGAEAVCAVHRYASRDSSN